MKRETFGSRLGFLLVSAGCAIGIGNVWRFPYVVGQNGGSIFVLFYLLFLVIMGAPILSMELAVGRAGKSSALPALRALEPGDSKWHWHGYACMLGNYLLMMYYTTVSGWMLSYFFKFATGTFEGLSGDEVGGVFGALLANPAEMAMWMAITVVLGFLAVSFGLQKGLERISKWMMAALLVLILLLAVHSFTLPGAKEGIAFYLVPNWEAAKAQGIGNVLAAAMNQAFFTLSVGIGSMEIFGSYMTKDHTLLGESFRICALDTFVAIASGLIIFPACFTFGVQPDAGPPLIFVTLPNIFANMAAGRWWGTLFFLFMTFASFSTVLAVFENLLAICIDNLHWSRIKSVIFNAIFLLIASLPCIFGYNIWSNLRLLGGRDVLDTEDFIVSSLLLPIGSLIFLLFCVSKWGWGYDNYRDEANTGSGMKLADNKLIRFYLKYILPVLVLVIIVQGLL